MCQLQIPHTRGTRTCRQDVRILFVCPPFFDFLLASGGAISPMGSPSISRTSRFDAIATVFRFDLAAQKRWKGAWSMVLQGCCERVEMLESRSCARRIAGWRLPSSCHFHGSCGGFGFYLQHPPGSSCRPTQYYFAVSSYASENCDRHKLPRPVDVVDLPI